MAKKLLIEMLRRKMHCGSYLVECKIFKDSNKASLGMFFYFCFCVVSCRVVLSSVCSVELYLCCVVLCCVVLYCIVLCCVVFCCVVLCCVALY